MNNKLLIGAAAAAVGIYFLTKKKGANANTGDGEPIKGISGKSYWEKRDAFHEKNYKVVKSGYKLINSVEYERGDSDYLSEAAGHLDQFNLSMTRAIDSMFGAPSKTKNKR
jgi:hypothetical protein